jgi:hypothetical protein
MIYRGRRLNPMFSKTVSPTLVCLFRPRRVTVYIVLRLDNLHRAICLGPGAFRNCFGNEAEETSLWFGLNIFIDTGEMISNQAGKEECQY